VIGPEVETGRRSGPRAAFPSCALIANVDAVLVDIQPDHQNAAFAQAFVSDAWTPSAC
jgi:hypothetical protein